MGFSDSFFKKVERKTKVNKETILELANKLQNGNMKDFEKNKNDFEKQLFETKMETAQRAFLDDFNNRIEIRTFVKDQA